MSNRNTTQRPGESFAGLIILALAVIGVYAAFSGFIAIANETDYIGGGLCLLAAAYALGKIANALFHK